MTAPGKEKTSLFTAKRVAALVLAVLALILIFQNTVRVSISVLWLSLEWPMWLALSIIFALGLAVGVLVGRSRTKRKYGR
ncbi:LapA family protein [Hoyosella subflava]|uniref:Lipopolysaccharide assembly protein A domain-containing protein n=1 Tax=Hoyosella subflava (strain DSM 45089 / JCM 17490 / NBRC 109087 / DQS3-9A1) TaxID=443218 RepID=F6EJC1_HOYSD|nr:LapA family protein [Hoyosella subflava]AEF42537.1 hypothetical protein AS9A_4103 [Hoyosella subflava DQS3-9A1]